MNHCIRPRTTANEVRIASTLHITIVATAIGSKVIVTETCGRKLNGGIQIILSNNQNMHSVLNTLSTIPTVSNHLSCYGLCLLNETSRTKLNYPCLSVIWPFSCTHGSVTWSVMWSLRTGTQFGDYCVTFDSLPFQKFQAQKGANKETLRHKSMFEHPTVVLTTLFLMHPCSSHEVNSRPR